MSHIIDDKETNDEICDVVIKGDLPFGYALRSPIVVTLHREGYGTGSYYWVDGWPLYGVGDTVEEALADYKLVLVDYYEVLEAESWRLAPHLYKHLQALRELLVKR